MHFSSVGARRCAAIWNVSWLLLPAVVFSIRILDKKRRALQFQRTKIGKGEKGSKKYREREKAREKLRYRTTKDKIKHKMNHEDNEMGQKLKIQQNPDLFRQKKGRREKNTWQCQRTHGNCATFLDTNKKSQTGSKHGPSLQMHRSVFHRRDSHEKCYFFVSIHRIRYMYIRAINGKEKLTENLANDRTIWNRTKKTIARIWWYFQPPSAVHLIAHVHTHPVRNVLALHW